MARKKGNWSAAELDRLRVLFPKCPEDRVASILNRSVDSVRRRAQSMFQRPAQRGVWTADDDHRLRVAYGVLPIRALALVLARSERDVEQRVRALRAATGRGPWSKREIALLKQLYGSRSDDDLEVCLSRPRRQIQKLAADLCLSKDKRCTAGRDGEPSAAGRRMPRWTATEEERLAEIYPHHDNLEIAQLLGRSVASVANKASQLGLKKSGHALREMGRRNVANRYSR